jgi:PiT family inorganic phosphate transporter
MWEALHLEGVAGGSLVLLVVCVVIALAFEFVNGFHDTANAVATVIYTHSLTPRTAVALSGALNFLGVWLGGIAVAMGIVRLLPVELLVAQGTGAGLAMVLSLLCAAISWNLGTWYFGIPASSSHTLIGSILGVGLASSWAAGHPGQGVNWHKAQDIGLALLVSPLLGATAAGALLWTMRRLVRQPALFEAPRAGAPPPPVVRGLLVATCGAVSFAHGSNDGQKGVGILMLVLIGIVPTGYALDLDADRATVAAAQGALVAIEQTLDAHADPAAAASVADARAQIQALHGALDARASLQEIPAAERFPARQALLRLDQSLGALTEAGGLGLSAAEEARWQADRAVLGRLTAYAPTWVLAAIACALGIGTTVGWQRIVVTVGEKIGKTHLTYAQGASAELVAASTIWLAGGLGLPVSTTHVLSSGVAGTMIAQGSGVQGGTVRTIALAWVLTLPVTMALSGGLFLALRALLPVAG